MKNKNLKKSLLLGMCSTLTLSFVLTGCSGTDKINAAADSVLKEEMNKTKNDTIDINEDAGVIEVIENLVKNFGANLKMVSLLAPEDILRESMEEYYGEFISESLMEKWISEPTKALGRFTSSPWPERIDIVDIEKVSDSEYKVEGEVVEVTSADNNESSLKYNVTLIVKSEDNNWVIDDVIMDENENDSDNENENESAAVYKNDKYGFEFNLPDTWKGYSIVEDKWEGNPLKDSVNKDILSGPVIKIRHPKWTEAKQRQDIPIMIFTVEQWETLQKGEFSVGAAPILPKELGKNSEYVFTLPARYNYEFLEGYEEVESILENNPLKPIEKK